MSKPSESLQDLDEGSSQAIQALLNSIAPGNTQGTGTADAVKKLTEKLGELVGEDAMKEFNQGRNERGELVNEDGLPIIEITEPLTTAAERGTGNALLAEDERPIPIAALPPPVRERWKQERDRILDLLEDEERAEHTREEQDDVEARETILRKRREAAAKEKEKMKAAKEMQKKMGKALLRDMAETRPKEESSLSEPDLVEQSDMAEEKNPKKSVAFAVDSGDEESPASSSIIPKPTLDWGDVTPARLQSTSTRPSLRSSTTLPMKMNVVERQPTKKANIVNSSSADSDDESDPETAVDDQDASNTFPLKSQLDDEQDSINSPMESESDGELVFEEEEYDMDFVQHQREIALQYHEKRSRIGEEALAAMASHSHNTDEDGRMEIPLDMPPSESHSKPSISQFRASRLASSYSASAPSSSSVSLGTSVLSASTARTIQKAVRAGKLDADGRLVGGDLDSASEDEVEGMQDVLELLKKGEVYNLGPDGNYIHTIPPRKADGKAKASTSVSNTPTVPETDPLPTLSRPKTSRFKLDRSQSGRPALHVSPPSSSPNSRSQTPISDVQRSSPKLPISSVMERHPTTKTIPPAGPSSSRSPSASLSTNTPFVVPENSTKKAQKAVPAAMPSMIVESPSFAKPSSPMPSMIVESPSFARPANPRPPTVISSASFPSPAPTPSSSRPTRPPVVLSSSVRESGKAPAANTQSAATSEPGKKISRFMADRM